MVGQTDSLYFGGPYTIKLVFQCSTTYLGSRRRRTKNLIKIFQLKRHLKGAAIAPWNRLRLPSRRPGLMLHTRRKTKINKKRPGLYIFKKRQLDYQPKTYFKVNKTNILLLGRLFSVKYVGVHTHLIRKHCDQIKIDKCLSKLPKNDFNGKRNYWDTFTKIA